MTNIDFLKKRNIAYTLSLAIILAGIVSLVVKHGPRLGIDFTGGTLIQLNFEAKTSNEEIRNALSKIGFNNVSLQNFVGTNVVVFRLQTSDQLANSKIEELKNYVKSNFVIEKVEIVGPAVGKWLIKQALFAFCLAFLGIIIYVAIRFNAGIWGISGVVALIHDVLVTVGIFSILNKEITLPVVAGLMTIVGYSINDTIVIFDRIRENMKLRYKEPLYIIMNDSINQTLSRTIITTLTTLISVFVLFLFGGEVLKDFALVLIIGMIAGTYSTIFIATRMVYDVKNK